MKTHSLSFLVMACLVAVIASCRNEKEETHLITEKIQYDVSIKSPDANFDWWIQNLPGPQREEFVNWIFDNALNGNLKAYDYFKNPLTPENINAIGRDTIYRRLTRTIPPFEDYDTMIVTSIEKKDVTKVRFLEKWSMEKEGAGIEKEVIAIAPVVAKYDPDGNYIADHPLFWLYFDEEKDD